MRYDDLIEQLDKIRDASTFGGWLGLDWDRVQELIDYLQEQHCFNTERVQAGQIWRRLADRLEFVVVGEEMTGAGHAHMIQLVKTGMKWTRMALRPKVEEAKLRKRWVRIS